MDGWIASAAIAGALVTLGTAFLTWVKVAQTVTGLFVSAVREAVGEDLTEIKAQLSRNGGESLKDAVIRIESKLDDHLEWSADEADEVWQALKRLGAG